jgi:tRNA(fMet)-specific endonuclease VapC
LRLALDTNRLTDLLRGDEMLVQLVETATSVSVPFVVLGELRAGFSLGTKGPDNERALQRLMEKPGVECLLASEATTRHYAQLYRQLREKGTPIPTNDLWIAALVVEHDLVLCSRDRHFSHLPHLPVI